MKYIAIVTTDKGTTWLTSINGTPKSIIKYFMHQWFNVGSYPIEKMECVTTVIVRKNKCEINVK